MEQKNIDWIQRLRAVTFKFPQSFKVSEERRKYQNILKSKEWGNIKSNYNQTSPVTLCTPHFTAGPLEHCRSFSRQTRVIFSSLFCQCRLHKINPNSPIRTQPSNYYNVCLLMYVCEHEYQAERQRVCVRVSAETTEKGGRLLSDNVVKMLS